MIKGLEALERLRNTLLAEGYWQDILQDVSIIEEELKDYQEINIKYKLAIEFIGNIADELCEHDLDELTDKIVKVKKALEIIKNKQVSIRALEQCVKTNCSYPGLTQEEYDLLKEVLL